MRLVKGGDDAQITSTAHRDAAARTLTSAIAGLERVREHLDSSFDTTAGLLAGLEGKVVTLGMGKSGLVAAKVAATLRSVGITALSIHAADAQHGDLGVVEPGDVAMLFSKSGTTRELMDLVPHLRAREATLVSIVGSLGSPLALDADLVLDASVEDEGCPLGAAPMASAIAATAIGDALAAAVTEARGFTADDFARLHPAGALNARLTLAVGDVMRRGAELPVVDVAATLKHAIIEITRTGYGAVCVIDLEGRLAGFVTDGDIRRMLLEIDDLSTATVADIMTVDPLTVTPELALSEALLTLERRAKPFLTAPVVDGEHCVGLLRLHDAVQAHLPA